jgi:hypothetical protein
MGTRIVYTSHPPPGSPIPILCICQYPTDTPYEHLYSPMPSTLPPDLQQPSLLLQLLAAIGRYHISSPCGIYGSRWTCYRPCYVFVSTRRILRYLLQLVGPVTALVTLASALLALTLRAGLAAIGLSPVPLALLRLGSLLSILPCYDWAISSPLPRYELVCLLSFGRMGPLYPFGYTGSAPLPPLPCITSAHASPLRADPACLTTRDLACLSSPDGSSSFPPFALLECRPQPVTARCSLKYWPDPAHVLRLNLTATSLGALSLI